MDSPRGERTSVGTIDGRVVTRGRRVPEPPARAVVEAGPRPRFVRRTPDETVVAWGATVTVGGDGPDRFDDVRRRAERVFESTAVQGDLPLPARPRFFGGFAFHAGASDSAAWTGFGDATFALPAAQLTAVDDEWWLTVTASGDDAVADAEDRLDEWTEAVADRDDDPVGPPPGVVDRDANPSPEGWRRQVRSAVDRVAAGELEKVVLARSLSATLCAPVSIPDALARLEATYPDCSRFAFSPPGGGTFFGATPERLVSLRGRTVQTEALAGSTGRGDTAEEDDWLAAELGDSEKDRHEHALVVRAIRDQLEPLAASVTTGDRTIRRLATVQHLRTPITAELATDEHVLSLVDALHPTPAVGGIPPDAALRTIRSTEAFDRGWYAAPVGWFDAAGDGTFDVAIRSAIADGDEATLYAGAGIVADSDPEAELDELRLKYRPILDVLE